MKEIKKLGEISGIPDLKLNNEHKAETFVINPDLKEAKRYLEISNINKKDLKETFRNMETLNAKEGKYSKKFLSYVNKFKENAKPNGIGILMSGNPGTGKTFLSNCIWNELKEKHKVYKTTFSKYVREIQDKFQEDSYLEIVKNADLIIIDDLGNEYFKEDKNGSWKKEILFNLINTIYENEICLIITTNLNEEKLKDFFEIKGSYKLYDKILEKCVGFSFDWKSRRAGMLEKEKEELFQIEV